MATTVNYKYSDSDVGIYGLYNDFFGIVERTGATVYNLTFKIKVTFLHNSEFIERPITPVGTTAVFSPLELVKGFFKSEYNGNTEHTQPYGYNKVRVELGAIFGATDSVPPTFEGYVTSNDFYVYNGYEMPPLIENYRNPNWYDTTPIKLPKAKKTLYLLEDDVELLSFPSEILLDGIGLVNAKNLVTTFYDSDNLVVSTSTIDLTIRPDLNGLGYWNININAVLVAGSTYSKSKIQYESAFTGLLDSEEITVKRAECYPKQPNIRLLYINNFGGAEYENFQMKSDEELKITKGKKIQSDGVNYKATSFTDIKNINNPNLKEYGSTAARFKTLRTAYLNQEQVNALEYLYKSSVVIMDSSQAVLVQDTSYKIETVKDGLVMAEVKIQIANTEPIQRQ